MKRSLLAIGLLLAWMQVAEARALSGFLAQCTAVAAGSCTEQTATGYARQSMAFSPLANGAAASAIPYSYAQGVTGTLSGHALYDAPTNGNLLAVLPYALPYVIPSIGDRGDVGALGFAVTAAVGYEPEAFNATYQTGATLGTTPDGSTVTTGSAITFLHGFGSANQGSADATTRTVTQTTGFTYAVPAGVSAVDIKGAGTLAAGTLTLPPSPIDGFMLRLSCSVTITSLTVNANTGSTFVGTPPSTCGANASHQLQYFLADTTWHVLF